MIEPTNKPSPQTDIHTDKQTVKQIDYHIHRLTEREKEEET